MLLCRDATYLVVDCGGGTLDVAFYGFERHGGLLKLVEITEGGGDLAGGSYVDSMTFPALHPCSRA
jgi:molecular chaperone DnaK (HSP70)